MKTEKMKIRITFLEESLGTSSSNPDIHREFIASKSEDALKIEEEVKALSVDGVVDKAMTVFPRKDGCPAVWDYQIKGYFKSCCGMLARAKGTLSSGLTAYKKIIDGLIFVSPRLIKLNLPAGGVVGECQRPLRAQTAQGERVALAHSETVPAGTTLEFEVRWFVLKGAKKKGSPDLAKCIREWLDYGVLRGFSQWTNSGKGRFEWEELETEEDLLKQDHERG